MSSDRGIARQEILIRLVASLILVFIAGALWIVGTRLAPSPMHDWIHGIGSGLLVLGIAGIWISYFAERQAGRNISRRVEDRFSILASCIDAGIHNVYRSRYDSTFMEKLLAEMHRSSDEICILAVAAREFLHEGHEGRWFAYHDICSLAKEKPMRLLLLHPWCEQAVSRGLREDPEHNTFERYRDTRLYQDVTRSCDTLVNWTSHGECVKARLYKVMPSSFFIMTSDVVFVEEYHFGTGGRASGKVPTLEVRKGNKLYTQLQGHFEFIWGISEQFQLSADLVTSLRNPVERESKSFEESIRFSRPDLFLNQS